MTWYDHGITYYHHLYKEHMINSWSTSKLKDTIHHFREPHFRHRHRHIHARSHGQSCRCPYILEVRPLHFNQLRGRLLKMILVVNPPKAGESNVYIKSIWMFFQLKKKGTLFPWARRRKPKIPQLPQVQHFDEVQKRQTKPGWSERQLPKMHLGDLMSTLD